MVKMNHSESLFELFDYVERQIASVKWCVVGWWKASSTEDATLMVPKGHIVCLNPAGPLVKFVVPEE